MPNSSGLAIGGVLALGSELTPGVYTLRVSVRDAAAKGSPALQWADFEIGSANRSPTR